MTHTQKVLSQRHRNQGFGTRIDLLFWVWVIERPRSSKEAELRLLFYAFPGGLPGMSLLLLRAVIGIAIIVQGGLYVGAPEVRLAWWLLGVLALASGCLLLIGFLTPLAGLLVGLDVVGMSLSALPSTTAGVFDSRPALIFGLTMLLAIIGAGPGRFSVDARMFGRREIIIPLPHSSLEH
jgi:uncharacterized membrane protein YphA (DoxX/SURF4 family)